MLSRRGFQESPSSIIVFQTVVEKLGGLLHTYVGFTSLAWSRLRTDTFPVRLALQDDLDS